MTSIFVRENYRNVQTVEVNQVVQTEGWQYDNYVVYEIFTNKWGVHYKVINLRTKEMLVAELIRPLSHKFGVGFYYDEHNPTFMDGFEVAILLQEAEQKKQAEADEAEKERLRVEEVKVIGRKRFAELLPEDALGVIVAHLKQDESDSQTDYFASSTQRTVILGFSTHKRDIFSEMRKHAANFEETTHLAEYNADYEHREKYSMGAGYYLGKNAYRGWIIEKCPIGKRENAIEHFAYTAGDENNIRIKKTDVTPPTPPNENSGTSKSNCTLVEYSDKAVAVFGETRAIKDELKAMGGRFNSRLTWGGKKLAGWIFSKSQEQRLAYYFGLD